MKTEEDWQNFAISVLLGYTIVADFLRWVFL